MKFNKVKKVFFLFLVAAIILPSAVFAETEGEIKDFYVNQQYDISKRAVVRFKLEKISDKAYFYIEDGWLKKIGKDKKETMSKNLANLALEFDNKIYPELTNLYGKEWSPGIDNDERITIVFQQMKGQAAGYFREIDEYSKLQNSYSNEREMVYLDTETLFSPITKSYLAHEFTHLITFNQKNRLRGVEEDRWLNEARADYSPTFLGYDDNFQGSNLEQRVKSFLESPSDSLTEWQNQGKDYGIANVFIQYLVEHYGVKILADSLKSKYSGIESINYALLKNGYRKTFYQIFKNWLVAVFINNCSIGNVYCYENNNLKNLRITPSLMILPSTDKTDLNLSYSTKEWAGHWYRIMGGRGDLSIIVRKSFNLPLEMEYVLCQNNDNCSVDELKNENGALSGEIKDFGKKYSSITLIPSLAIKITGFTDSEPPYNFVVSISIKKSKSEQESELIKKLLAEVARLKDEIAIVKAKIAAILAERKGQVATCQIDENLYYGLRSNEVACLQRILAKDKTIYPEGLVTGFFGKLTKAAVIRLQEKYADKILKPIGLIKGTGFVGPMTRRALEKVVPLP